VGSYPCNCQQAREAEREAKLVATLLGESKAEVLDLRRRLEIAELRLERVQLAHACPHPGLGDAARSAWDRRCRWIDSKLEELGR
jgi:hypothetical protein